MQTGTDLWKGARWLSSPACLACKHHEAKTCKTFDHYSFQIMTPWSPAEPLQVSIFLVLQQHVIEPCFVFRVVRKCQTVARHSRPSSDLRTRKNVEELITWRSLDKVLISDLEQSALIILGHEIAQNCPVINKGV